MNTVITYPGTGLETVYGIFEALNVNLEVITEMRELDRARYDGLLLLGGADISPAFYGEHKTYSREPDRARDQLEWAMIRRAMTAKYPILGICRGCQMINVAHGGSLYQDIERQGVALRHAGPHLIRAARPLVDYLPTDSVNSLHHQAVKTLPDRFKPAAHSEDGIIEAIYKPGVLGVQWHPELLFRHTPGWIALFRWFTNGLN